MEWVEVRGKTVDIAVEAALRELEVDDRNRVDIEVIQEPEKGFLGIGGKDAIVRVKPKPKPKKKRRRRRKKGGSDDQSGQKQESGRGGRGGDGSGRSDGRGKKGGQGRSGGEQRGGRGGGGSNKGSGKGSGGSKGSGGKGRSDQGTQGKEAKTVTIEEQAPVVKEFLTGLVDAFGLEGEVTVEVDDDTIVADIRGPQTEAMVGPRGSVIEAIHELTKTVLQRKTQSSARVRLDIAGYAERRRQALTIYADQLIDQALEEGGEIMLEPMSAGDRKVIHDAVAAREGVRSYSEGESPERYVVIASEEASSEEE